jgi:thiol-disulfide isomerase/thioredoxin
MLTGISKKIELAANLAIIVVAFLLATVLVKSYLLTKPAEPSPRRQADNSPASELSVSSLDIDWKQSKQTLVFALSTECHFCTESAPFYRKLAQNKGDTHLVVVLPQSVEEGRKYLEKLGVSVDEVRQSSLDQIGVHGTPSLLLVDDSGVVKNFWVGRLPPDQETIVLNALSKGKG